MTSLSMRACAVFLFVPLVGCSSSSSSGTRPEPEATEPTGAGPTGPGIAGRAPPPAPPGAPPPDDCQTDADCRVAEYSGPDITHPCCNATITVGYYSVAYLSWVESYRAASCAGVTCAPLPIPGARLSECGYQARCANGRCANTCEPTGGAP